MKLQPGPAGVEVKMLSGSAIYDVKPKTTPAINPAMADARTAAGAPVLNAALRTSSSSTGDAEATALAYRMPVVPPQSGMVFAPAAISTGTFLQATITRDLTTPSGLSIVLPGSPGGTGAVISVNAVVQGGVTTYVITGIAVPVQEPNGTVAYVTANASNLIGAQVVIQYGNTGQQQQISIFPPGVSTSNPANALSGTVIATSIQTAATGSFQTSTQNGQLPAGTSPPTSPNPVTTLTPASPHAP
jgi:hypothetical protein